MQRVAWVIVLGWIAGCGGEGSTPPAADPVVTPDPQPLPPPSPAPPAPTPDPPVADDPLEVAGLTVHEWGLIDVRLGETRGRVRAVRPMPPAPRPPPATGIGVGRPRAPLLYFHLAAGHEPVDLAVRVQVPGGTIAEHWPAANMAAGDSVSWNVRVRSSHCRGSSYPRAGRAPCPSNAPCEAASLTFYETTDSSCLTVSGADYNHLFYAGESSVPLPLEITRVHGGLRIRNNTVGALPGLVYVVHRAANGADTKVSAQPFGPGSEATMSAERGIGELQTHPANALLEYGLTQEEMDAFKRAWDVAFFGIRPGATPSPGGPVPASEPTDFVLFWLPEPLTSQVSTVEIVPPPETLRRAFLVRVDLG
jgi:hypothetical protein